MEFLMEKKIELYDILTLDDDQKYVNLQELEYEKERYHLLVLLDEEERPTEEHVILKYVDHNGMMEFEDVSEKLAQILFPLFQDEYEKNQQ